MISSVKKNVCSCFQVSSGREELVLPPKFCKREPNFCLRPPPLLLACDDESDIFLITGARGRSRGEVPGHVTHHVLVIIVNKLLVTQYPVGLYIALLLAVQSHITLGKLSSLFRVTPRPARHYYCQ